MARRDYSDRRRSGNKHRSISRPDSPWMRAISLPTSRISVCAKSTRTASSRRSPAAERRIFRGMADPRLRPRLRSTVLSRLRPTVTRLQYGGSIAVRYSRESLYIADSFNNRVRKVSGGVITTVAGNGVGQGPPSPDGGPASVPVIAVSVATDPAGNLYVGGFGIRKVTPAGTISTVASMINAVSLT